MSVLLVVLLFLGFAMCAAWLAARAGDDSVVVEREQLALLAARKEKKRQGDMVLRSRGRGALN